MQSGPTWLGERICYIVVVLKELKDWSCYIESIVTLPVIYRFSSGPDSDLQAILHHLVQISKNLHPKIFFTIVWSHTGTN